MSIKENELRTALASEIGKVRVVTDNGDSGDVDWEEFKEAIEPEVPSVESESEISLEVATGTTAGQYNKILKYGRLCKAEAWLQLASPTSISITDFDVNVTYIVA